MACGEGEDGAEVSVVPARRPSWLPCRDRSADPRLTSRSEFGFGGIGERESVRRKLNETAVAYIVGCRSGCHVHNPRRHRGEPCVNGQFVVPAGIEAQKPVRRRRGGCGSNSAVKGGTATPNRRYSR